MEAAEPPGTNFQQKAEGTAKKEDPKNSKMKGKLGFLGDLSCLCLESCSLLYVQAKIAGNDVNLLVDTGSTENFCTRNLV